MSEDEREQKLWQELAKKIFELCLEETVLEIDSEWNISNISTLDFSDSDLEKVKDKIKKWIDWIWFWQALEEYSSSSYQYQFEHSIRRTENSETDINNEIDAVVKTIISTMDEVDRARERKNIKFNPDKNQNKEWKVTWELSSRWHSEKITVSVDNSKNINSITIEWLWITFTDIQEWFRTVNFINWIHNNAKSHPYWSDSPSWPWHLGYYQWSNWWDLERDVLIDMWIGNMDSPADIDIIESDKLREKFGKIQNSEDFLGYINDFLQ